MHAGKPVASALEAPPVRGSVDVVQGAYGQRGNLELIAPHADDGFVVLWFNGDDEDGDAAVARRSWSAGVHVATGNRLDDARIAQLPLGVGGLAEAPLEVVVRGDGAVERWIWRAGPGFVRIGPLGTSTARPSAPVVQGHRMHLLLAEGTRVLHVSAALAGYPDLRWTSAHALSTRDRIERLDLTTNGSGLDARLGVAGAGLRAHSDGGSAWSEAVPDLDATPVADAGADAVAVAWTRSTLDGGTLEVVGRRGDRLVHGRRPADRADAPLHLEPIVPLVRPAH